MEHQLSNNKRRYENPASATGSQTQSSSVGEYTHFAKYLSARLSFSALLCAQAAMNMQGTPHASPKRMQDGWSDIGRVRAYEGTRMTCFTLELKEWVHG